LQINIIRVATEDFSELSDSSLPDTVSLNSKVGAVVPKGSITEGVNDIFEVV